MRNTLRRKHGIILDGVAYAELSHEVAGLPTELDAEDEEAKRFDLLILNLQLAVLRQEPSFARLRDQVKGIAGLLQDKASIPMIQAELPLILDSRPMNGGRTSRCQCWKT